MNHQSVRICSGLSLILLSLILLMCSVVTSLAHARVWTLDIAAPAPYGFTGLHTSAGQSTTIIPDSTFGSVLRMQSTAGHEQLRFGGYVRANMAPCSASGAVHFRWLVKYGDADGQDWWSGSWFDGGFEFKAWDFRPQDVLGRRIITLHRRGKVDGMNTPAGRGTLHAWIRWETGSTIVQPHLDTGTVTPQYYDDRDQFIPANTWMWIEMAIRADRSISYWWAPYTGTGTEYTESSPQAHSGSVHSYNFAWLNDTVWMDYGFQNHDPHFTQNWYYGPEGLVISESFIGPGAGGGTPTPPASPSRLRIVE